MWAHIPLVSCKTSGLAMGIELTMVTVATFQSMVVVGLANPMTTTEGEGGGGGGGGGGVSVIP